MRFLPTIQVDHSVYQIAFPDWHALRLAEVGFVVDREERRTRLLATIVESPMLLLWTAVTWSKQPGISARVTDYDLETDLLNLVEDNLFRLTGNHGQSLSSIHQIRSESLVDVACFGELKSATTVSSTEKLMLLLAVMEIPLRENPGCSGISQALEELWRRIDTDVDRQDLGKEFQASDFLQYENRDHLLAQWQMELPFFLDGLSAPEELLQPLHQLQAEFADRLEREKIAAVQQLAYGASHEVNNPLANISTRAQALLRDETDPKRRQRLETIDRQAFRAHDMIRNLMVFAKPRTPVPTVNHLPDVFRKIKQRFDGLAAANQIQLQIDLSGSQTVVADPEHLMDMLAELVQNAIESVRSQGRVILTAREQVDPHGGVTIEVLDDGPGITPEVRRHMFDPFFSGREAGRGLGFGLSKVWRLMDLHRGTVQVTDREKMTCIRLNFPSRAEVEIDDPASNRLSQNGPRPIVSRIEKTA